MRVFDSKQAAGVELAPLVQDLVADRSVTLLAVDPGGLPVAQAVADALGVVLHPIRLHEGPHGLVVDDLPPLAGQVVVVIDDGVETGTAAHAIGAALVSASPAHRVLAVPVCPREALATLQLVYDEVIAIERPLVRRSLRWHFADW
jgi:predicted phosphoribosyltransferase